jgi:hypothetical protein
METDPEYYEGKLSEEARNQRRGAEQRLDELYEKLEGSRGIERAKLSRDLNVLEQRLAWQGANPKELPFEELRDHVRMRRPDSDGIEAKYRERIKNRATAIRAYCVECQGGFLVAVKECPSVTCPLHPFRMGSDPLRGWDIPKVVLDLPEEDEEEAVGVFEDGDEDDADDTAE